MKISNFTREFNFRFIAIVTALSLLSLAVLALVSFEWYRYFPSVKDHFALYTAQGRVLEYGSQVAIPDVRIEGGVLHMFTDYSGSYRWPDLSKETQLTPSLPADYEGNMSTPIDYRIYKENSPFKRTVIHNFYLVLKVEATAERVFTYLSDGSYSNIWTYITPKSQAMWSVKSSDFENALSTERALRTKKDKSQLDTYEILDKGELKDGSWFCNVLWTRKNGEKFKTIEKFEKQDGWWHYVWQRNPKEVYQYIDTI